MSDSLPTDGSYALDALSDVERDAKIEQLLLVGLDHYFAAQYDDAINVWTRALFLDRSHPRARAYIERARSALNERQRESEELLQTGVAAFHRGDGDEARRLLQAAIDGGAPADEALALLERLNRLEKSSTPRGAGRSRRHPRASATHEIADRAPGLRVGLVASFAVLLVVVAIGVVVAASWDRLAWRALLTLPAAPAASPPAPLTHDAALPLPRRGELALTRARALNASGRLHDALSMLDLVRPTDPQKADADRLRSDIQRQLRGLAALPAPSAAVRGSDGGPTP